MKSIGNAFTQKLNEIKRKLNNYQSKFPVKYFHGMKNIDVTGDYILKPPKKFKTCFRF